MEKAQRLVRDEKWYEAIFAYQEIINKAPGELEPKVHLAKVYQMAGQFRLALGEYQKNLNFKNEGGPNRIFILESERIAQELKKSLLGKMEKGV